MLSVCFALGVLITIAEPDLQVLSKSTNNQKDKIIAGVISTPAIAIYSLSQLCQTFCTSSSSSMVSMSFSIILMCSSLSSFW